MTSETTERKPQRKLKWDACDRWMVGQGCEVGYLGIGIALRDRAPLYVALPGGKRHVFGLEGSAWRPHDFRLAVAWVALQLDLPVPWRTEDEPSAEEPATDGEKVIYCPRCQASKPCWRGDTYCVCGTIWPMPTEEPPAQSEAPGAEGEGAAERFACRHHTLRRVVGGAGVWTCKYCAARFAIANLST